MNAKISTLVLGVLVTLATACAPLSNDVPSAFQHDVAGDALPWTHDRFDASDDVFTFALFSDLTGGERDRVFEIAVAQLNLLRPELIVNVGDLIEGDSDDPAGIAAEWDSFDDRADHARAPLFYVGGNHDLTSPMLKAVWDERYGRRYYHFRYKDVLFLILDTEDNSPERMQEIMEARQEALRIVAAEGREAFGTTEYSRIPELATGNIGPEQSEYFLRVLEENPDVRWTFLFMHKAPWEREDEPNFAAIEQALTDIFPAKLFGRHVGPRCPAWCRSGSCPRPLPASPGRSRGSSPCRPW